MKVQEPLNSLLKSMNDGVLDDQAHIYLQPFLNSINECNPTLHDCSNIGCGLKLGKNKRVPYFGDFLHGVPWKAFEPSISVSFPSYDFLA